MKRVGFLVPAAVILQSCVAQTFPAFAQVPQGGAGNPLQTAQKAGLAGRVPSTLPALMPEVEEQILRIESAAQRCQGEPEPSKELIDAIEALRMALPFSARTRALITTANRTHQMYLASRTASAARQQEGKLRNQLREVESQKDFVQVMQALETRLEIQAAPSGVTLSGTPLVKSTGRAVASRFPYDRLKPGDILLWNASNGKQPSSLIGPFDYANPFSHAAIYLGNQGLGGTAGKRWTYEARSLKDGVRSFEMKPGEDWATPGRRVAIGRVKAGSDLSRYTVAIRAYNTFGDFGRTKYHTFPPWYKDYLRDGLYCSQLVWVAYKQSGIDLDSNDWRYITWFAVRNFLVPQASLIAWDGIFPDELRKSDKIDWYYDQVN